MKISLLTQLGSAEFRGAGKRGLRHAHGLADRHGYCELITGLSVSVPAVSGLAVRRAGLPEIVAKMPGSLRSVCGAFFGYREIGRILKRSESDAVHLIPSSSMLCALAIHAARRYGKAVIAEVTLDGSDDPLSLRRKSFGRIRSRAQCSADAIVCISPPLVDRCTQAGVDKRRIFLIPNDVDTARFSPAPLEEKAACRKSFGFQTDEPLFLYAGIISERKNVLFLVEAFAELAKRHRRARLVLAGPVDKNAENRGYVRKVRERAVQAGILERVTFIGETDKVAELMKAADQFWFSSKREGFGTVLAEAMSSGLPVVAKRIRGVTDFIIEHGKDGYAVDTLRDFIDTSESLVRDRARVARIAKQARATAVRRFSRNVIMAAYDEVYCDVLQRLAPASASDKQMLPVPGPSR